MWWGGLGEERRRSPPVRTSKLLEWHEVLIQQTVNGVTRGAVFALIALGYTMVYGIIGLINFAHGDVFMLGLFISLSYLTLLGMATTLHGWQLVTVLPLVFLATMLTTGTINVVIDRVAYRPLRHAFRLAPLITAIGVSFMLENLVLIWKGPAPIAYPDVFPSVDILREWLGMDSLLFITTKDVLVLGATIPLMVALQYFVTRTRWGKAMRATAQDKETALAMGIDVEKTIILTFFIGGALAGAAGLIQGLYYNIGMWWMGYQAGLRAFTAAVLGGIGSMPGTALGAYPFLDRWLQAQTVHAVTDAMIYVLLALGLNIVVGYAGLLDLGYAAFFAIGAYTMGLLNSPVLGSPLYGHAWSFWVVIWIAALVSAGLGVVIGAPTLRVRGDYLAIITLAFGEIIPVAIRNLGDITIDIGGWRPVERLNLTGGENGVNPVGRPHLPGVNFDTDFIPWYFLILVIGAVSLWAMSRMRDSRLGRAWMAIREDETAADCTGVNPVKTKLLAFALGASFAGFAGSFYAAKLQAITPGAFEFNVSIMLLCMVVLGGMGSLKGVILGGMLITLFDRILLAQMSFLVRWIGRSLGVATLASVDLTLWRWFFFGLGLVVIMLIRPEGLAGRRVRPPAADVDEREEALALVTAPPRPRADALPGWLREATAARAAAAPVLEVRGLTRRFGGLIAVSEVDLVTGLLRPDRGEILVAGKSLVGLRPHAIVGRGIARTFQSIRLFQNMTVLDNVLVGEHCRLRASVAGAVFRPPAVTVEESRARARAKEMLAFVGLADKDGELAKNLAYGDQRRLEIARALATEPALLLLDEPTAGMNPRETDTLTELIGLLRNEIGLAVLLIEHHMEVVMAISDRITVLDYGTRIAEGTPGEIRRDTKVIEAYLGKGYEQELVSG